MKNIQSETRCIFCGGKDLVIINWSHALTEPIGYKVKCSSCYAYGPYGNTVDEAIENYKKGLKTKVKKMQPQIFIKINKKV